jgi:hypothetical protein
MLLKLLTLISPTQLHGYAKIYGYEKKMLAYGGVVVWRMLSKVILTLEGDLLCALMLFQDQIAQPPVTHDAFVVVQTWGSI